MLTQTTEGAAGKRCSRCEKDKPVSGFYVRRGRPYQPCRECRKAIQRHRYRNLMAEINRLHSLLQAQNSTGGSREHVQG